MSISLSVLLPDHVVKDVCRMGQGEETCAFITLDSDGFKCCRMDLSINHIVPTAIKYQNELINNVQGLKSLFSDEEFSTLASGRLEIIREILNK